MTPTETAVAVGGGFVAVGFPLLGYLAHRVVHSTSRTSKKRRDGLPPAHGHDRRR